VVRVGRRDDVATIAWPSYDPLAVCPQCRCTVVATTYHPSNWGWGCNQCNVKSRNRAARHILGACVHGVGSAGPSYPLRQRPTPTVGDSHNLGHDLGANDRVPGALGAHIALRLSKHMTVAPTVPREVPQ